MTYFLEEKHGNLAAEVAPLWTFLHHLQRLAPFLEAGEIQNVPGQQSFTLFLSISGTIYFSFQNNLFLEQKNNLPLKFMTSF